MMRQWFLAILLIFGFVFSGCQKLMGPPTNEDLDGPYVTWHSLQGMGSITGNNAYSINISFNEDINPGSVTVLTARRQTGGSYDIGLGGCKGTVRIIQKATGLCATFVNDPVVQVYGGYIQLYVNLAATDTPAGDYFLNVTTGIEDKNGNDLKNPLNYLFYLN